MGTSGSVMDDYGATGGSISALNTDMFASAKSPAQQSNRDLNLDRNIDKE